MLLSEEIKSPTSDAVAQEVIVTLSDDAEIPCSRIAGKLVIIPRDWPVEVEVAAAEFRNTLSPYSANRPLTATVNCSLVGSRFAVNVGLNDASKQVRFPTTIASIRAAVELAA